MCTALRAPTRPYCTCAKSLVGTSFRSTATASRRSGAPHALTTLACESRARPRRESSFDVVDAFQVRRDSGAHGLADRMFGPVAALHVGDAFGDVDRRAVGAGRDVAVGDGAPE